MIDTHVHVLPEYRLRPMLKWIHKNWGEFFPLAEDVTEQQIVDNIFNNGVTTFWNLVFPMVMKEVHGLNDWNLEFCARNDAVPVCTVHEETPDKKIVVTDLYKRGSFGIKLHPQIQQTNPAEKLYHEMFDYMNEVKMPLFLHTGTHYLHTHLPEIDYVKIIESIAERYTEMPIVMVHMLLPDVVSGFRLLEKYDNVWGDLALVYFHPGTMGAPFTFEIKKGFFDYVNNNVKKFADKLFCGSDFPTVADVKRINEITESLVLDEESLHKVRTETPKVFYDKYKNSTKV